LNGRTNVQAFNLALGAEPGHMMVPYIDYTQPAAYGGWAPGFPAGKRTPVAPLDDILPCADFLKIDVEGMELAVLQGARRILAESRPVLYVEANVGPGQQPLIAFLKAESYRLWWHHAPHFNPDNIRHEATNDLPDVPAPAILAMPLEERRGEELSAQDLVAVGSPIANHGLELIK